MRIPVIVTGPPSHMPSDSTSTRYALAAFAEFERELIRERTKIGLRAAMDRGSKPGHPRSMDAANEADMFKQWSTGRITKTALGRKFGVHISSIKRAIRRAGLGQNKPAHAAQMALT